MSLYLALLFVVLTPGVLLTLPKGGARITVALVHGLVFAVVYHFTYKTVWRMSMSMDGFQNMANNAGNTANAGNAGNAVANNGMNVAMNNGKNAANEGLRNGRN